MEVSAVVPLLIALVSLVSGVVLVFAAKVVNNATEDKNWWRDKGFGILSNLKEIVAEMVKRDAERDELLKRLDERNQVLTERAEAIEEKAATAARNAEELAAKFLKEEGNE